MNGPRLEPAHALAGAHASLFSLHGRIALVTGASSGLGREMAISFAMAGAQVLVNGRDAARVADTVNAITSAGGSAEALCFDVADAGARAQALALVAQRWGRVDVLVNNAGQRLRSRVEDISPEAFDALLHINLGAVYALSCEVAALMRPQGYGRIVMISSIAATLARAGDVAYISAKGGLAALTRALACEWGPYGITCNALAPGAFLTDANRSAHHRADAFEQRTPLGRWGQPQEIAGPALFLASDASSYVNGHLLTVDGGYSISF